MSSEHQRDLSRLEEHYAALARAHGDSAQSAQWADTKTQEARMRVLLEGADLRDAKVLDLGCGAGHLLSVLRREGFAGEYVGYDLAEPLLDLARAKHPAARFERRDVLTGGVPEPFDHVFISGVFNNQVSDNWGLTTSILRAVFPQVRRRLAFNALSTYVDFFQEGLFYMDPADAFRFCKEELSPSVVLRHDYEVKPGIVPFEFTLYVHASAIACRKRADPGAKR